MQQSTNVLYTIFVYLNETLLRVINSALKTQVFEIPGGIKIFKPSKKRGFDDVSALFVKSINIIFC